MTDDFHRSKLTIVLVLTHSRFRSVWPRDLKERLISVYIDKYSEAVLTKRHGDRYWTLTGNRMTEWFEQAKDALGSES